MVVVGKKKSFNLPFVLLAGCSILFFNASNKFLVIVNGQDDFTPLSDADIDQSLDTLEIDLGCNTDGDTPNAMFTVEVGDTVSVSTVPEDLVKYVDSGTTMSLQWTDDKDVLTKVQSAGSGVKITFPADQLKKVSAKQQDVQITDGFTGLTNIDASKQSSIRATFSSLTNDLIVSVSGQSSANIQSNENVQATVQGQSSLNLAASSAGPVTVSGQSSMGLSGDISGTGDVSGQSSINIDGSVTTGSVSASSQSSVNANSCDNVSTSDQSSCNPGTQSVTVDNSEQSTTKTGTKFCAGGFDISVCIGGNTKLWSCTQNDVVSARDVQIGESVRTAAGSGKNDNKSTTCSDVYYVFHHKEETSPAIRFNVRNTDSATTISSFDVSYNHIVYVGETFENRRPVLSQDVKTGDKLVTSSGGSSDSSSSSFVEVVSVEGTDIDLVNVLTIDPHLEVQLLNDDGDHSINNNSNNNVVISAFAYDEDMYGMLFAPVKYIYLTLGATAVESMKPLFDAIDSAISAYFSSSSSSSSETQPKGTVRGIIDSNKMIS